VFDGGSAVNDRACPALPNDDRASYPRDAASYYVRLVRKLLTKLARSLVICTLLAALGVFATSARSARTELLVHFVLPGGDTECEMVDPDLSIGNVTCAIHRHRFRCSRPCDLEKAASRRWHVDVTRVAQVGQSRRGLGSAPTRVLRPGQALTVGNFRCTSRAVGLTCVSRPSGHGFFLSKDNKSQRLF
jgi:hypothetical protein